MNIDRSKQEKFSVVLTLFLLFLAGCSGIGDSNVGEQEDLEPSAKALAIGLGANNSAREGQEIILSGKDSDGLDGPILTFQWTESATNPISIQLKELSVDSVSFTAPAVSEATSFTFDLTVIDADAGQATDSVTLTVLPARDPNHFLSFDAVADKFLDTYQVTLIPEVGQVLDINNSEYSLSINVNVKYPDRNSTCEVDGLNVGGNTCLNYVKNAVRTLDDFNQTVNGNWQNNNSNNAVDTPITLPLPRLILSQFNQNILNSGLSRDNLLDNWKVDDAEIEIIINLTTEVAATLLLTGPNQNSDSAQSLGFESTSIMTTLETIRNLGSGTLESKATAQAYYDMIDPNGDADTLNKWLVGAGFADDIGNGRVVLKPGVEDGVDVEGSDFAHAIYTNNFDLGFGRDMFVRVADDGSVYSYVVNYPTLEAGIKKVSPIATVVMEYSPPVQGVPEGKPEDYKFVKYYTYIPDETGQQIRTTDFDFDGRGQKYMPGVCAVCHGGKPKDIQSILSERQDLNYVGDIEGTFLPWDLDSFLFSDTDPAIININEVEPDINNLVFNKASQEEQFRKLNEAVFHIYKSEENARFDTIIDLIGGDDLSSAWYSEVPCEEGSNKNGCISGSFSSDHVPEAWSDNSDLYTNVIAKNCRVCHVVQKGTEDNPSILQMATPEGILSEINKEKVKDFVFNKGVMPLARLTMDRLWSGTDSNPAPSQLLWEALGEEGSVIPPGLPLPEIKTNAIEFHSVVRTLNDQSYLLTKSGRSINIDGSDSLFSDDFQWRLLDTTDVLGFENCLNEPSALVANGDKAVLTATTANIENQFYCIQLTASNDVGSVNSEVVFIQVVDNRLPNILFSSHCETLEGCLSVSELNDDPVSSTIALGAVTTTEGAIEANTLFHIVDEDINDALDPKSIITFELSNTLQWGELSLSNFNLEELDENNLVSYSTNVDEVGIEPFTELLEFDVFDNGNLVSGLSINSAEININPVSDNSPVFGTIQNTVVGFGQGFNSLDFEVTDADEDLITLDAVSPSNSLGNVQLNTVSNDGLTNTYNYSYAAKTAREIAQERGSSICVDNGDFGGSNSEVFQFIADDGSNNSDIPVTRNVSAFLTTTLNYENVAVAYAGKVADNGTCISCHDGSYLGAPLWPSSFNSLRSRINITQSDGAATDSVIFTHGNNGSGHTGGNFTTDFISDPVDRDMLEWIYQCAPN